MFNIALLALEGRKRKRGREKKTRRRQEWHQSHWSRRLWLILQPWNIKLGAERCGGVTQNEVYGNRCWRFNISSWWGIKGKWVIFFRNYFVPTLSNIRRRRRLTCNVFPKLRVLNFKNNNIKEQEGCWLDSRLSLASSHRPKTNQTNWQLSVVRTCECGRWAFQTGVGFPNQSASVQVRWKQEAAEARCQQTEMDEGSQTPQASGVQTDCRVWFQSVPIEKCMAKMENWDAPICWRTLTEKLGN